MDANGCNIGIAEGNTYELKIDNHCPYVNKDVLNGLISLRQRMAGI